MYSSRHPSSTHFTPQNSLYPSTLIHHSHPSQHPLHPLPKTNPLPLPFSLGLSFTPSFHRHPGPYAFEAVERVLVVLVAQFVAPTCVSGLRGALRWNDDAAVIPAEEARVAAFAEAVVDFGAHFEVRL
jgi:hypothetical protein